jgi:hypothetical protein
MPDLGNTSVFLQSDAGNNTGTAPSWSGSAAPSTLDDAGRALQGAVTREWNWRNFTLTATGTADAKVLTYSVAPAAYYNGQRFAFKANTTNTGSATLNVNSLGAKTIKSMLTGTLANLAASDMVAGMFVEVCYNTADDCFVWVNQAKPDFATNATDSVRGLVELATAAEFRDNTSDRALATNYVWAAADTVALSWTSGGTTAVDLDAGINFTVTTATGNSTLGAPTNAKVGQSGFIYITQDGSTPRELAYNAAWVFAGGNDPALTAVAGAKDVLFYQVLDDTGPVVFGSLIKGVA